MKIFMESMVATLLMMVFAMSANAQMYGTGMMMGNASCGYESQMGDEATSIQDDIKDMNDLLKDKREELRDAKARQKELNRKLEAAKKQIEKRGISSDYLAFIYDHIDSKRQCHEYSGIVKVANNEDEDSSRMPASMDGRDGVDRIAEGIRPPPVIEDGRNRAPAEVAESADASQVTASGNGLPTAPYSANEWTRICDSRKAGRVTDVACEVPTSARVEGKFYNRDVCRTNLKAIQDTKIQLEKTDTLVAQLEGEVELAKDAIRDLKGDYRTAVREHQRDMREQMTEGGCIDCMIAGAGGGQVQRKSSAWDAVANFGLGLASMYLGSEEQKYTNNLRAKLGGLPQSYPTFGYGYPFIMAGIGAATGMYGAISGSSGQGAFGCASGVGGTGNMNGPYGMMGPYGNGGMYGGGMYGYPQGMYGNPMGGGMYMPGMGPWGMNGPMGGMMGGNPGGMFIGGGIMMGGGGMMGMPMGYMVGGMPMGAMMGSPMGMMVSGGAMMGGGGMMGYPMGGMMGMPMGGMTGMMASGGLMMGGGGMMGMPMGGMMGTMMGGGGMMGYPMGGMMGMAMGMGMDTSQMQMQMYQQQMQMQMQQYQQYMQMQQRYQDNYMAKQRVVAGLQGELYSLMARLQQAQMGMYSGGYLGFDTGGTLPGYPTFPGPGTLPGSMVPGTAVPGTAVPGGYYPPPTGTTTPTGGTGPSVR